MEFLKCLNKNKSSKEIKSQHMTYNKHCNIYFLFMYAFSVAFCLNRLFFAVKCIFHATLNSNHSTDNKVKRSIACQCCPADGSRPANI